MNEVKSRLPRQVFTGIRDSYVKGIQSIYRKDGTDTTSIGSVGTIVPSRADRGKGILNLRADTRNMTDFLIDVFICGQREIQNGDDTVFPGNKTRLSVRVFVSDKVLPYLMERAEASGIDVEAMIKINNANRVDWMVYLGYNSPTRRVPEEEMQAHTEFLRSIANIASNPRDIKEMFGTTISAGYGIYTFEGSESVERINQLGTSIGMISPLISTTFGYDSKSAEAVITNPGNVITVGLKGNVPVGFCAIERTAIEVENYGKLKIAELTDVVVANGITHGPHYGDNNGNNLYFALTTSALTHMARAREQNEYTIFGEYTLTHKTAARASAHQGQILCGILPLHADVGGKLTTFAAMSVPNESLLILKEAMR